MGAQEELGARRAKQFHHLGNYTLTPDHQHPRGCIKCNSSPISDHCLNFVLTVL